jgi:transglutaminase-like putative cysteine protease
MLIVSAQLLFSLLLGPAGAGRQDVGTPRDPLPAGWTLEPRVEVDAPTRAGIAKALGAPLSAVTNQRVSVRGGTAQINVVRCLDEKDATALERTLAEQRGSGFISRKGTVVLEIARCDVTMAKKVRDLLGLTPPGGRLWEVQVKVGCADRIDAAKANAVWNLFLEGGDEPPIRALSKEGTFGTSIRLWTAQRPWFHADYAFTPTPLKREDLDGLTTFTFREPSRQCGIPYVDVRADIRVRNAYHPAGERPSTDLRVATSRWPVEKVRTLAGQLTSGARTPADKVDALLTFVFAEIKYGGPVTGSRFGVEQVLSQKLGHCWDKSDVFVTLCRAAGMPARQIAGWLAPLKSGHVWSEVYLDGQGWLPVDPTTPWTGTSDDYIPWFSTSDGEMPILYLSMPTLRIKE